MNILIVSQYFWPENFRINDLVRALIGHRQNVDVLTGQPNYPTGKTFDGYRANGFSMQNWEGATIHRVPLAPRGVGSALRLVWNYVSFVLSGSALGPFALRGRHVDVIVVYAVSPILQALPAIFLKWIKGAKLVILVQDLWPESLEATGFIRNRTVLALVRLMVRWIYARADLLLVQSEAFIEPVAALADRGKIAYHPNTADDVFVAPQQETSAHCPIPGLEEGFSVVFAGNLGTAQSVETIVEAAALLKDMREIRFVLVGDGSRVSWIEQKIAELGLKNVQLTGRYPLASMPSILKHAGALLVTLKDEPIFAQTIPSKVQVYLAMARPVVACLNGEGARIVQQANAGVSCKAEDAHALAMAIRQLAALSVEQRNALGQNGLRYFRSHFDRDMLTKTLIDHFQQLMDPTSTT